MLKPIGDHILVEPMQKEEKTKSGLFIPDAAQEKSQQGKVVSLGQGKMVGDKLISFEQMGIKKGDMVMFTKYGPTEIKIDEKDYLILESGDILGVIEPEKVAKTAK